MGLAASQARLLFITMRQNDVSAKMQRISNENLILARDAEDLDNKYKQMKNRETYQVGGVDLSYDALMGSQAVTNGSLILLQNAASGAVVLSPSLGSKLGLEGVGNGAAFKSKYGDQTAFISKMTGMSVEDVRTILSEINKVEGSQTPENEGSKLSINAFLASLSGGTTGAVWTLNDDNSGTGLSEYFGTNSASDAHNRLCNTTGNSQYSGQSVPTSSSGGGVQAVFGTQINSWGTNGTKENETSVQIARKGLSIQDLYNKAGSFESTMFLGGIHASHDWNDAPPSWDVPIKNFKAFADIVSASLSDAVGKLMNSTAVDLVKTKTKAKCDEWSGNKLWNEAFYDRRAAESGYVWNDQGFKHSEDALGAALMACQGQAGIVAASDDGDGYDFAVDAGKFVKDLINELMLTFTGGACYDKTVNSDDAKYNKTESYTILSKYTVTETETPKTPDEVGKANVQFYKNMYNTMAVYGYQVDEKVNTSSYLNEKLQNNQYCINGKPVGESNVINKKVDESVKEEAQEFYDMEMAKIKRKEKQLDNEMKALDTEHQALKTEQDSVKTLIGNNVEKSFNLFS